MDKQMRFSLLVFGARLLLLASALSFIIGIGATFSDNYYETGRTLVSAAVTLFFFVMVIMCLPIMDDRRARRFRTAALTKKEKERRG